LDVTARAQFFCKLAVQGAATATPDTIPSALGRNQKPWHFLKSTAATPVWRPKGQSQSQIVCFETHATSDSLAVTARAQFFCKLAVQGAAAATPDTINLR
jgi:uncharacterized protein YfaP (DUF2135 family)